MNAHSASASGPDYFQASLQDGERHEAAENPSRRGLSRLAPAIAFFVMVFASMAAAAAVVTEAPLMLVGLY